MLRRRLALVVALAAFIPSAHAYRVVTRSKGTVEASSLSFSGGQARLATASGLVAVPMSDVDFYETFASNAGSTSSGSNVVVFLTGSLFRYDSIQVKDGHVKLGVEGGGFFLVPEALIDFEATVVEGALVNLPAGSGAPVAVSRPAAGGDVAYEGESSGDEAPSTPRSRRSARGAGGLSRRGARDAAPPEPVAEQAPLDQPVIDPAAEQAAAELAAAREAAAGEDAARKGGEGGMEVPPGNMSPRGRDGGIGEPPGSPVEPPADNGERTNVQVVVTTDFADDVAGLSLDLLYPATCTVKHPTGGAGFSGFAAGFTTAVNVGRGGNPASPLRIGGFTPPNTKAAGPGEFFRGTFQCTGASPDLQGFKVIGASAHDDRANSIPAFTPERTDISVQVQ